MSLTRIQPSALDQTLNYTANTFTANYITFGDGTTQTTAGGGGGASVDQTARTQANTANLIAIASYIQANTATTIGQAAYLQANTATTIGQAAYARANSEIIGTAAYVQANTATTIGQAAYVQANTSNTVAIAAYVQANTATTIGQAAFGVANTKFDSTGGTITGNVTIQNNLTINGNLNVIGSATTINTSSIVLNDPLIYLASNNYTSDAVDIGLIGHYNDGTSAHTGIFRDPIRKEWIFFKGYVPEVQSNNIINIADPSFAYANVYASVFKGNLVGGVTFSDATLQTTAASPAVYSIAGYGQANTATTIGQAAYVQANTATTIGQAAYVQANTANTVAIAAYVQANTSNTVAIASYVQANTATTIGQAAYARANSEIIGTAAYVQANAATIIGQAAYIQANTSNTVAISSYVQANTATTIGQAAYIQANTATTIGQAAYVQANTANTVAIASYVQANTATTIGQAAYVRANSEIIGTAAYVQANAATTIGQAAYVQANTSNTVAVSAYAQANTATIIAQAAYNQANVGGTSIDQTARTYANNAYYQANTATIIAQAAYNQANVGGTSIDQTARTQANLALLKANTGSITGSDSITIGINAGYYNDSNSAATIAIGNNAGQGIIVTSEYVSGGIVTDNVLVVTSANGIFVGAKVYGEGYTGKGVYVDGIIDNTSLTLFGELPDSSNGTLTFVMNQNYDAVAIGNYAGQMNQGGDSVAIGTYSGQYNLTSGGVAIGLNAGIGVPEVYRTYVSGGLSGNNTVILNDNSGLYKGMEIWDIVGQIGIITYVDFYFGAGDVVSIKVVAPDGVTPGLLNEPASSFLKFRHHIAWDAGTVAIGKNSGAYVQGYAATAVGKWSGQYSQGQGAAAFGWHAGEFNQGQEALAVGHEAGNSNQSNWAVAIGNAAGNFNQGSYSIAIGDNAGQSNQGQEGVAIGHGAGFSGQSNGAIAIGASAGVNGQGSYSIAIGANTAINQQNNNSIIINATGLNLDSLYPDSLSIAPIRNDVANTANVLYYNIETKEVTYAPPAGGSFGTDSWARVQANSAFNQANTATIIAQAAYAQANVGGTSIDQTARTYANNAYYQANTATTIGQAAYARANSEIIGTAAYVQANAATIIAQSSYSTANLKFNTSGGTITGNTTINANLIVTGANVSLGNVGNVHIYGGNTGQLLSTDNLGNLNWIDLPTPNTVTYTANSLIQTNGVFVSGNLWSTQVFGDYASSNGAFVLTDGTGSAPAWYIDFDFINVVKFNRVVLNINYTQSSGHTIYVQLYNNLTSTWDNIGTYTGLGSYYAFALEVIDEANYVAVGITRLRLYHSNAGNAGHQTSIDYVALEQSYQGPQGPRGPTGATGSTGATGNGVATGGTTGQVLIKNSATDYDTAWSSNLIYSFNTGNLAFIQANTATIIGQAAYIQANTATIIAQAAYEQANVGGTSIDQTARTQANSAYIQANTATITAQAAFDKANTGGGGGSSLGLIVATVLGWNLP